MPVYIDMGVFANLFFFCREHNKLQVYVIHGTEHSGLITMRAVHTLSVARCNASLACQGASDVRQPSPGR